MIDERLEELAALHALGALSAEEERDFEGELAGNGELRKFVAELKEVSASIAGTAPQVALPPGLRDRILARIEAEEKIVALPTKASVRKPAIDWLAWALAACLAVLCGVFAMRDHTWEVQVNELERVQMAMSSQLNALNRTATALQNSTNELQQAIARLRETNQLANMRIAMLGSLLSDQPKAVAVSLWDEQNQNGVFVVENLKPLPDDKDYQLWVIDPQYGIPVDAGVFKVDADGKVRFQFKAKQVIKTANKFAVTEEQKGGSPTPKGQMVMVGG